MPAYVDRARSALERLQARTGDIESTVRAAPNDSVRFPRKALDELLQIAQRVREAGLALDHSLRLIEVTALDVVDMQVRLQGETARLAGALKDLGRSVEKQHFMREAFDDALWALDEAAQLAAASIRPSAVRGLREVNVRLWDFEKVQYKRYTDLLTSSVQSGRLTSAQLQRIQRIADGIVQAFVDVNELLNDLAESRSAEASSLERRLADAPERLSSALRDAERQLTSSVASFAPIVKTSRRIAEDVAKLLKRLVIPIFPTHERLCATCDVIERDDYENLSGVQTFSLLNILARMLVTTANGRPLVAGRDLRVTHVFPDRIYFEAHRSLVDDLREEAAFKKAPASLHRFKEGSFKQRTNARGNLQLSYQSIGNGRVALDADIDLYRAAVPHLFGEVLVNHLTGNTTDQYAVRSILDEQGVTPVGEFRFIPV